MSQTNHTTTGSIPAMSKHIAGSKGSFAERMMQKMGWQEGQGLGKNEDGVAKPILPVKRQQEVGVRLTLAVPPCCVRSLTPPHHTSCPSGLRSPSRLTLLSSSPLCFLIALPFFSSSVLTRRWTRRP